MGNVLIRSLTALWLKEAMGLLPYGCNKFLLLLPFLEDSFMCKKGDTIVDRYDGSWMDAFCSVNFGLP